MRLEWTCLLVVLCEVYFAFCYLLKMMLVALVPLVAARSGEQNLYEMQNCEVFRGEDSIVL